MKYLVDAYNLLFRSLKKCKSLEKTRELMIQELNDTVSRLNMHVVLVFDGAEKHLPHASRGHFDALELVYTSSHQTADEYITQEVSQAKSPSQITVVSNDRELTGRCKQRGAKKLLIDEFIALISKKSRRKKASYSTLPGGFRESQAEFNRLLLAFEKKLNILPPVD